MKSISKIMIIMLSACMIFAGCKQSDGSSSVPYTSEGDAITQGSAAEVISSGETETVDTSSAASSVDSKDTSTSTVSSKAESVNNNSSAKPSSRPVSDNSSAKPSSSSAASKPLTMREQYIENLKKSDVFKKYSASDWRSHAYDYKLIAFTFDDGPTVVEPGDNHITKLIDAFEPYKGAATFFFTGKALEARGTKVAKYALEKGHELGNHSYNHVYMTDQKGYDKAYSENEVDFINNFYKNNLNYTVKFYRGGGHSYNTYVWNRLTDINMPAIKAWKCFNDYGGGSDTTDSIIKYYKNNEILDGAILGMHGTETTMNAMKEVLPYLYDKGYRFCTLSELFEFRGVDYNDIPKGTCITKVELNYLGKINFGEEAFNP